MEKFVNLKNNNLGHNQVLCQLSYTHHESWGE